MNHITYYLLSFTIVIMMAGCGVSDDISDNSAMRHEQFRTGTLPTATEPILKISVPQGVSKGLEPEGSFVAQYAIEFTKPYSKEHFERLDGHLRKHVKECKNNNHERRTSLHILSLMMLGNYIVPQQIKDASNSYLEFLAGFDEIFEWNIVVGAVDLTSNNDDNNHDWVNDGRWLDILKQSEESIRKEEHTPDITKNRILGEIEGAYSYFRLEMKK